MKMNNLIAYTYDFISYLTMQGILKNFDIQKIILFGSVARGDYDKSSDIDIFIDTKKAKGLLKEIHKIEKAFLSSARIDKWERVNINNNFSFVIGDLNNKKWTDLKKSMVLHAFVLFDRFTEIEENLKPYALIKWYLDSSNPKKRVGLSRKLYGYKLRSKEYKGILDELQAKKIGRGVVLLPLDKVQVIRKMLAKLEIKYSVYNIYM